VAAASNGDIDFADTLNYVGSRMIEAKKTGLNQHRGR